MPKKATAGHTTTVKDVQSSSSIPWPPLPNNAHRYLPIELEEILESQILLIHNFIPAKACVDWVNFLSSSIPLLASPPAQKGEAQRTNHRFSIQDDTFAKKLWQETGLKDLILDANNAETFRPSERPGRFPSGLNPNIRVYRYEPGQSFAPHYDDTVRVGKDHTEWTLLIYLTGGDSVKGGETAFYPSGTAPGNGRKRRVPIGQEDVVVELEAGMALLHRHGRECLLHEGRSVTEGVKWVLRSDVVLSAN